MLCEDRMQEKWLYVISFNQFYSQSWGTRGFPHGWSQVNITHCVKCPGGDISGRKIRPHRPWEY